MPSYQDYQGRDVQLGSQINQGGEGKIYRIVGDQSHVAKIWREPSYERAIKLKATIENPPVAVSASQNIRYCWPQHALYDGRKIAGYIMPAVDTNEFRQSQEFFNETLRKDTEKKLGVTITEKTLLTTARDLCAAVAEIHAAGHVIGDVNEKNVLINSDGNVRIVDIDAIQIYDPQTNATHRCTVGRDEYTPPRLQGQSLDLVDRTTDDDCFGLAVMIFKLTMGGRHPFTSRLSRDDDTAITGIGEKIKNEYFPYNQDDTVPDQYKVAVEEYKQAWDNSRDQIRTLFLQTFDPFETRNRPRPTATEWTDELDREIELIEQGKRKPAKPTRTSSPQISGNTADNQAEVQRALNRMQKDLKQLVIAYADQLQRKNLWSTDLLPKNAGTVSKINGVAGIRACSDTLALLHCLISLSKKLKLAWARDQSLSQGLVSEVKDYRNDEHELDLFDDQYTTRALQAIKKLHDGIKAAPKSLPDAAIWRGAKQPTPVAKITGSTKNHSPYPQPSLPSNPGPRTPPTPSPVTASSYSTSAPAIERIPAISFIAAVLVAIALSLLTASPRIPQDWTLPGILLAIVAAGISLIFLAKTSKLSPNRSAEELKNAGTFVAKEVKSAFQATGRISNQKTKWTVRIAPVVALAVAVIYLSTPPGYFGLPALAGTPIAQPKPQTTQETKSSLPTRVVEASPQMVTAPATSNHGRMPGILPSTCTQTEVGNTVCIGNPEGQPEPPQHLPDDSPMLQSTNCFQHVDSENVCWDWIQETPTGVQFLDIQKGTGHACGIKTDQTIVCWGANVANLLDAPPGEFVALTAGGGHSCALRNNGNTECWGDNSFGQLAAPANQFKEISAGSTSTCGIDYDNALVCWGNEWDYQFAPIGTTELTTVSSGYSHACGLQNDGTPICWGGYEPENNIAPAIKLVSINAGAENTCGITTDGNAVCWGKNKQGETQVPQGRFTDIQTGGSTTCGLRPDGSIECWGWAVDLGNIQRTPPGPYRTFQIHGDTCGIRFDDTASCWSTQRFTTKAPEASVQSQKRTADQEQIQRSKNRSALINQYAHCNRTYSDQEARERAQAITNVIRSSTTTIDAVRQMVNEQCPPIPVNDDATATPHLTTTSTISPQTIPTIQPTPIPTPSPYHLSTAIKPIHVQQLDADGGLLSSQNYEIAACYYDPHDTEPPRKWKLFTQPDQSLLEPVFTIHFTEPINLQHGLCYEFNVSYMGPTEWRVCASQPYGGNCDHNSSDFLWEREIPAFRGNPDSATYIWTPDPDNR